MPDEAKPIEVHELAGAMILDVDAEQLETGQDEWAHVLYLQLKDGRRATALVLDREQRAGVLTISDDTALTRRVIEEEMREIGEEHPSGITTGTKAYERLRALASQLSSLPIAP